MQESAQASSFNLNGRSVEASHGIEWIGSGFGLFKQAPLIWILCVVILLAIYFVLGFIPVLGSLAANVLLAVFAAGLLHGAEKQHRGEAIVVGDLFSAFQGPRLVPLIIVGALYTLMVVVVLIVASIMFMVLLGASGGLGALVRGDSGALLGVIMGAGLGAILIVLIVMAVMVPIAMAVWFAPALVALNDVEPIAAMKASFRACLNNFVLFLLYGIIMFLLVIVGSIPFGLGLLVVLPLIYASTYAAYRDIFTDA
jgi:uncharacterized membrane protein